MLETGTNSWTAQDASDLYDVSRWGNGFFSVSEDGHVLVHPDRKPERAIDMKELIDRLRLRGLDLPVLLRFNGILQDRLREMHDVFASAIAAHDYRGCLPGIHWVLRRQGLMQHTHTLNPHEQLAPGQAAEIERVYAAYPHLTDDDFVAAHLKEWLS